MPQKQTRVVPVEEQLVVRGTTPRRLLLALVVVIVMAGLAGEPAVTEPARAAGTGYVQVPLRWCAIRGTTAVSNPGMFGEPNTDVVLVQRSRRASNYLWLPGAGVFFRSAIPAAVPSASANFPVIDDPRPPLGSGVIEEGGPGPGVKGDILQPTNAATYAEFLEAGAECAEEWDKLALARGIPLSGPIALNVRRFVDARGTPTTALGNALDPVVSFSATTPPPPPADCKNPPAGLNLADGGFMGVVDFSTVAALFPSAANQTDLLVVAHELGHVLKLGHGNGLDDDGDVLYDEFCDNATRFSPPGEDPLRPPGSIMHPVTSGVNYTVTTRQRQTARAIASVTPGFMIDPPLELVPGDTLSDQRVDHSLDVKSASVDMTGVSLAINAERKRVILSHTLFGLVSKGMTARRSAKKRSPTRYVAFLDLDSNRATGGRPAELGFRTRFKGAELVTRVLVKGRRATPRAWRFEGGRFADVTDRRVTATVSSPVGGEMPFPTYDVVSAQLPAEVVGRVGSRVRLQAKAAGKGKWVDILPGERRVSRRDRPKGSVPLFMFQPKFPVCTTSPKVVRPGDVVTIKAAGFKRRGEEVQVMIGDELVANLKLRRRGIMSADVAIPETTSEGPRLITVVVENTALTADCVLRVGR
jgi:hypothetical protein